MALLPITYSNSSSPKPSLAQLRPAPLFQNTNAQWGPDAIGTIVFGVLMLVLGVVAVWQSKRRTSLNGSGNHERHATSILRIDTNAQTKRTRE